MVSFLRRSLFASCATFYTVLVCLTAGGSSEWRPDAPAGRVLMQSCSQASQCSDFEGCAYCNDETNQCQNDFRDTDQCSATQGSGYCNSGICEVCVSTEPDCLSDGRDDECVRCNVRAGVQYCDSDPYDGDACTSEGEDSGTCEAGKCVVCSSSDQCAGFGDCVYCNVAANRCDNAMQDSTQCTAEQGAGTCYSGVCEVCVATDPDCLSDGRDDECVACNERAGVRYCDSDPFDGDACTLGGGGSGTCAAGKCVNSVVNDPIISGFDGTKMHFDEVGDFTLIQEGGGWKVEATFSAAPTVEEGGPESRESSWTTAVRVASPQGDMVSCTIPTVFPNTSLVQVSARRPGADPLALSSHMTETTLGQVAASAILSWKEYAGVQYSSVVGCKVLTPLMDIKVYQVSGWEEAQAKPEEHGWASPFTWLNIDFHMRKRLAAPVTGIMGDTYPKEGVELNNRDTVAAGVGEVLGEAASARQLRKSSPFHLSFSLVGL